MKYKQKLKVVEAFQYQGDLKKLSDWFLENSSHATLPFYTIGREVYAIDGRTGEGTIVKPGCYIMLSANRKNVNIESKEDFEAAHVIASGVVAASKKKENGSGKTHSKD